MLSLGTAGYLVWFVGWHSREFVGGGLFGPDTRRWECTWELLRVEIYDSPDRVAVYWSVTPKCSQCFSRHRLALDCFGHRVSLPMLQTSSVTVGPISYQKYWFGTTDRTHGVLLAAWLPIPVLATYPALFFLIVGIRRIRRRRAGHCLHCDYDLTKNESGVCPECGTDITPSKPLEG